MEQFPNMAPQEAILPHELRKVLGSFTTGVVVVTTLGADQRPMGLTINSFNSVSMDPPLILWSLALKAPSLAAFRSHTHFAINILSAEQEHLGQQFARPSENKFANVAFTHGIEDVPLLEGATAHLECRTYARYPGGDHEIYLGEVVALEDHGHEPLVYHRGSFRRLMKH